jgi:hypothetical protein
MTDNLPEVPNFMTGGCMCGAVRYRISEKPIVAALCHCNRCRPQSGSAFSTVIIIKRLAFELEGETTVFEDVGASDLRVGRRSCARCGSPLTTEADVTPDLMFVKTGGIDHNEWFRPVMELFVTRRRPRVAPVPGAQQLDGIRPSRECHHSIEHKPRGGGSGARRQMQKTEARDSIPWIVGDASRNPVRIGKPTWRGMPSGLCDQSVIERGRTPQAESHRRISWILALPREAREANDFNVLPESLGKSCLIDLQCVSA